MSGILDRMLQPQRFIPTTADEYLALQLARRLGDELAIKRYMPYVAHHAADHLVRLCHAAKREEDPARAFHSSLTKREP
jgi:hypothetical protein